MIETIKIDLPHLWDATVTEGFSAAKIHDDVVIVVVGRIKASETETRILLSAGKTLVEFFLLQKHSTARLPSDAMVLSFCRFSLPIAKDI